MANTTWSTTDKLNCTLSGGNLIATAGAGGGSWVRGIDKQVAGKFYWEVAATTFAGTASAFGVASINAALVQGFANPLFPGSAGIVRAGSIQVDGNTTGITLGSIVGATVCFAIDCTARQLWIRLGAAGNWNNSASANPATGAGSIAISLGAGIAVYPAAYLFSGSDAITANFGDSAFSGAVPSGFTSGFTAGASVPTNALATMVAVEHWLAAAADAQVTQVAVEHWASVAEAAPSTQGARAMVLA